jgi:hypothetical protein
MQFVRALGALLQAFGALGLTVQLVAQAAECGEQRIERGQEAAAFAQRAQGEPPGVLAYRQPQVACGLVERAGRRRQRRVLTRGRQRLGTRIARQFDQLRGRYRLAEEHARGVGQRVRLVEDHRIARRQQLGEAGVAQRDVGEEQMMVDHHQIGGQRVAPRLHHEAALEVGTLAAQTVVARRGGRRPGRRVVGHARQFAAVAGLARCGEALDLAEVAHVLRIAEQPFARVALQMVVADVVGAALEQGHRHRHVQRRAHARQVAIEQLILQRLGAGRDDHLAPGEQRRDQIGERLAGAGARLGDQHAMAVQRLLDRQRQLELALARTVAGHGAGERPLGGEHVRQTGAQGARPMAGGRERR